MARLQEAVRIIYKDNDILYVNINSLHKISKYTGKEGTVPKVNKLGSDAWQKLKEKTKTKVKEIAFRPDQIICPTKKRRQALRMHRIITCKLNWKLHSFMRILPTRARQQQM